jgi:hypothetical protein
MSDTPKKLVVNIETGIQQYVDLTPDEIAQRDQDIAAYAEQQAIREAEATAKEALKVSAKAKLVAGEPLTPEEASVLVI